MTEEQLIEEPKVSPTAGKPPMDTPMVSIIIPVRNEAKYLRMCLDSIQAQTYDHSRIEVLIVNGKSVDETEEIAKEFQLESDLTVRILQNNAGNTPCGLNMGYRNARGDYLLHFIGHASMPPDFIEKDVRYLKENQADAVGGLVISTCGEEKTIPKAIGYALNTPFGLGGVTARTGTKPGYIDNPSFGCYRRELFDRYGYIDERLTRNQDYEYNQRITSCGAKIFFTPEIKSYYFNRPSYKSLWREYFNAAKWRTFMIGRFVRAVMLRHLAPPALVIASIVLAVMSFTTDWAIYPLSAMLALYTLVAVVSTVDLGVKKGFKYMPAAFLSYYVIHFAYGLGFIWGFLWFVIFRRGNFVEQAEAQ